MSTSASEKWWLFTGNQIPANATQGTFWLAGDEFYLPVKVRVRQSLETGSWVAEDTESVIWGSGTSLRDALTDVRSAFREYRDVLDSEPLLSRHLTELRDYLRTIVKPQKESA